jgi:hypothetical protein
MENEINITTEEFWAEIELELRPVEMGYLSCRTNVKVLYIKDIDCRICPF